MVGRDGDAPGSVSSGCKEGDFCAGAGSRHHCSSWGC